MKTICTNYLYMCAFVNGNTSMEIIYIRLSFGQYVNKNEAIFVNRLPIICIIVKILQIENFIL